MNVLPFRSQAFHSGWNASEMQAMETAFAATLAEGKASGWAVGETERGDPQVYLLGPLPQENCILCISRVGRRYVIEDGTGGLLSERGSLLLLAEQLRLLLRNRGAAIVARIGLIWCAGRKAAEEKVELFIEPMELLSQIAPLAAAA
jgi:hypothetical protein